MNKSKIIYSILTLLFGAFMVVYGGVDDSPGAQLLGILIIIFGVINLIKNRKGNFE